MTRLTPCPHCQRHVRTGEACCPFCARALPSEFGASRETAPAPVGVKRARLFASSERSNGALGVAVSGSSSEIQRASRRTASVLLGSVLGASLVAAACGSDDESTADVMQQDGERAGPTPSEAKEPSPAADGPTNAAEVPEATSSPVDSSGPAPSATASNTVPPAETISPGATATGPAAPGASTAPSASEGPRPDGTVADPGDVGTTVPLYGAVIPPFDEEVEQDAGGGAGGASGMANTDADAGALDAGSGMGGMKNEPPQVQPLYGAPPFSEE